MDYSFNSIARSHGEKNGVRAGRPWRIAFAASVAAAVLGGAATAQTPAPPPVYVPTSLKADAGLPRTPQGRPDFQGEVWESPYFAGLTGIPLITPSSLVITEAQSKTAHEGMVKTMAINPLVALDPEIVQLMTDLKGFPLVRGQRRSRLLVLPADGRMPLTKEAQAEVARLTGALNGAGAMMKADNPEERMPTERCLTLGGEAPYTAPNAFNPIQFTQTAHHIVIQVEGGDARIIPFADRHGPGEVAPPMGDSIARWEGDTLVIETIHNPVGQRQRVSPFGGVIINPDAKVIERITRVSRNELIYQFTVEDPKVYSAPWLGEFSMYRAADNRIHLSGCHEGNYGLTNILAGARFEEARNAEFMKVHADTTAEPAATWTVTFKGSDVRSWAVLSKRDAAGEAQVALRIERPAANPRGLSEINVFKIDCTGKRLQVTAMNTYAANNLTGARTEQPFQAGWQATSTRPAIAAGVAQACA